MVDDLDRPYVTLKVRLLDLFTPKPADQCLKLILGGELVNRRPSQLIETMLALMLPGEEDGVLFKLLYVTKLPSEVWGHMMTHWISLSSREMDSLADDLWFALNQCHYSAKSHPVAAAVPEDTDELEEAVATLNVQPKQTKPKKKEAKPGKPAGKLCCSHDRFGEKTWKCDDPGTCPWSEINKPSNCSSSSRPQGGPQLSPLPGGCGQLQVVPGGLRQLLWHPPPQAFS